MAVELLTFDSALAALADPTRRAILDRLARGEARVTELAKPFSMSLNAVSKHIRILERARLVTRRRVGREHLLSLNAHALDETARWMNARRTVWSARLDALDQALQDGNPPAGEQTGKTTTGAWHEHA